MKRSRQFSWLKVAAPLLCLALAACVVRPVEKPNPVGSGESCQEQPLYLDKDVDLLFVIDNSGSMAEEQKNLVDNFPKLVDALKSTKLGDKLPNVRLGVVSTDLGAGNLYSDSSCHVGGDGGKLTNTAKKTGCTAPSDKWIEYKEVDGQIQTNIVGAGDPIAKVKAAFSCIAELGDTGCGFEQTLLSAKQALDPVKRVNPGFLRNDDPCCGTAGKPKCTGTAKSKLPNCQKAEREDAMLALVFITDEDDCSASNDTLFDGSQQGLNDPLGPLTSFRCFEFGVQCTCPGKAKCDRFTQGIRTGCKPGGQYLHNVNNFISFFRNLKKKPDTAGGACAGVVDDDRVIMAAIAGPTGDYVTIESNGKETTSALKRGKVEVGMQGQYPSLKPACTINIGGKDNDAAPGVRIRTLVHAFAKKLNAKEKAANQKIIANPQSTETFTPFFKDDTGNWREQNFTTICSSDFSPALKRLGERIVGAIKPLCMDPPALTDNGGILCRKDDVICDAKTCSKVVKCKESCLSKANFTVQEYVKGSSVRTKVKKCSEEKNVEITVSGSKIKVSRWDARVTATSCGTGGKECPCWRIVPAPACTAEVGASPYRLEIMRECPAVKGTMASVCSLTSSAGWGTQAFADLKQCN